MSDARSRAALSAIATRIPKDFGLGGTPESDAAFKTKLIELVFADAIEKAMAQLPKDHRTAIEQLIDQSDVNDEQAGARLREALPGLPDALDEAYSRRLKNWRDKQTRDARRAATIDELEKAQDTLVDAAGLVTGTAELFDRGASDYVLSAADLWNDRAWYLRSPRERQQAFGKKLAIILVQTLASLWVGALIYTLLASALRWWPLFSLPQFVTDEVPVWYSKVSLLSQLLTLGGAGLAGWLLAFGIGIAAGSWSVFHPLFRNKISDRELVSKRIRPYCAEEAQVVYAVSDIYDSLYIKHGWPRDDDWKIRDHLNRSALFSVEAERSLAAFIKSRISNYSEMLDEELTSYRELWLEKAIGARNGSTE